MLFTGYPIGWLTSFLSFFSFVGLLTWCVRVGDWTFMVLYHLFLDGNDWMGHAYGWTDRKDTISCTVGEPWAITPAEGGHFAS